VPRAFATELEPPRTGRFAVVGDLQRTSFAEVWRASNRRERERLVVRIAEARPDFLVLLGDLVFCGSSQSHWAEFDALCAPIAELGVPVLPLLGNHEYWLTGQAALRGFYQRFPALRERHWYSRRYGGLALLMGDSNAGRLSPERRKTQVDYLRGELERCDADAGVLGTLLFVHHPPYTNSTVTPDDLWVKTELVPPFLAAAKTLALVSGHVHSYERFHRDGRMFVVAGGGGPRVRLHAGEKRRHDDDLIAGPEVRPYHFLLVALEETGVDVEMLGIDAGGEEFHRHDRFHMKWRRREVPSELAARV